MVDNELKAKSSERNSSLEILRIIAMLFIIISHSSVHGFFSGEGSKIAFNNYFLDLCVLGNLGVDIFAIISGYFLCYKENPTSSILRLWSQVWFYSLSSLLLFVLLGNGISISQIIKAIFPTIFREYWFFTAYVMLILFTPYINFFIQKASHIAFKRCLLLMLILWSFVATFTCYSYTTEMMDLLLFYFLGAYFRMYPNNIVNSRKLTNILLIISISLLLVLPFVSRFLNNHMPPILNFEFNSRTSVVILICTISIFLKFATSKPYINHFINKISTCTFGVYLFHDNPFIRELLWKNWLPNYKLYNSPYLILGIICSVLVVFCVGTAIELLRQKLIEKPMLHSIEKITNPIINKLSAIF